MKNIINFVCLTLFLYFLIGCSSRTKLTKTNEPVYSKTLSSEDVTSFMMDDKGYMWIGTSDGLNLFDGHRYRQFFNIENDSTSLVSNNVTTLFKDSKGGIWIGTDNGLCRYEGCGNFKTIPIQGYSFNITRIGEMRDGTILALIDNYIYSYNSDTNVMARRARVNTQVSNSSVYFLPTNNGFWCIAPMNILHYNSSFRCDKILPNMSETKIITIAQSGNYAWISSRKNGLVRFNINTGEKKVVLNKLPILPNQSILYNNKIIFNSKDGIYSYNIASGTLQQTADKMLSALNYRQISSVYLDYNHSLWIGFYNGGFTCINNTSPQDRRLRQLALFKDLEGQSVISLTNDNNQNIWGALADNRFFYYDIRNDNLHFYSIDNLNPGYYQHRISNLFFSNHHLWIFTTGRIYACHLEGGNIKLDLYKKFGMLNTLLGYASTNTAGDIAITTDRKKLLLIYNNLKMQDSIFIKDSYYSNKCCTAFLPNGKLLVCMQGLRIGIIDFHSHSFKVMNVQTDIEDREKIMPTSILVQNTKILIGTNKGLYELNNNSRPCLVNVQAIPHITITDITKDMEGNIWVTSHRGLIEFTPGKEGISFFSNNWDPNSYTAFNPHSICMLGDSAFVIGHTKGCSLLLPQFMKKSKLPHLYIEDILIKKDASNISGIDLLSTPTDRVNLSYDNNDVSISFAAIDFSAAPQNSYSYMMKGFDNGWIRCSSSRRVNYTNLPAGTYQFLVKMEHPFNPNINAVKQITIHVAQHPLLSTFAILIYIVIALMLIIYINKLYLRIHAENIAIQMAQKEKEREQHINEMNMDFFANISHEFRNPLTMIAGPVTLLSNETTLSNKAKIMVGIIGQSVNQMLRLIDQMLDFNKLENDVLRLEVKQCDAIYKVDSWIKRFGASAIEKDIHISREGQTNSLFTLIDEDKLDKILGNLLSNALKHTPQNGSIRIFVNTYSIEKIKEIFCGDTPSFSRYFYIGVFNSGSHIPDEQLDDIFKRYYQVKEKTSIWGTGIGLYYVKQLVSLHHGLIKANNDGTDGVIFHVALPIDDAAYESSERTTIGKKSPILQLDPISPAKGNENEEDNKPRLLIVDDDTNISYYLRSIFIDEFNVFNRYDAESALDALMEISPDIILSDVVMSQMSGYEFCRNIKEDDTFCHIPVILITAKSQMDEQVKGLKVGANAYVTKPFDPNYLQALVQSQLANVKNIRKLLNNATQTEQAEVKEVLSPQDKALIDHIYQMMGNNLHDSELNMNDFCKELCISRSKFYYKIKSLTGETPNNFFKRYKLNKAAQLLKAGTYNVSEVADMTGFSTISHFSVSFKKEFGINPSEYK